MADFYLGEPVSYDPFASTAPARPAPKPAKDDRWEITKGIQSGLRSVVAMYSSAAAAGADAAGADSWEGALDRFASDVQSEAAKYAGKNPTVESVLNDPDKFDALSNYVLWNIGQGVATSVPVAVAAIMTGGVGGLAASYGMGVGDVRLGERETGVADPHAGRQFALGVPYAMFEKIGAPLRLSKILSKGAKSGGDSFLSRLPREMGKSMGGEAVAEYGQEGVVESGKAMALDKPVAEHLMQPDVQKQMLEGAAAGAVGGSPYGVVNAMIRPREDVAPEPVEEEELPDGSTAQASAPQPESEVVPPPPPPTTPAAITAIFEPQRIDPMAPAGAAAYMPQGVAGEPATKADTAYGFFVSDTPVDYDPFASVAPSPDADMQQPPPAPSMAPAAAPNMPPAPSAPMPPPPVRTPSPPPLPSMPPAPTPNMPPAPTVPAPPQPPSMTPPAPAGLGRIPSSPVEAFSGVEFAEQAKSAPVETPVIDNIASAPAQSPQISEAPEAIPEVIDAPSRAPAAQIPGRDLPIGEGTSVRVFLGNESEPFYESARVVGFESDPKSGESRVVLETPDGTKKWLERTLRLEPLDTPTEAASQPAPAPAVAAPAPAEKSPAAKKVRKSRGPVRAMDGDDLLTFLRRAGGVKDEHGELRAMDLHRPGKGVPFIMRKTGMGLDEARETVEQAGFLPPDSTVRDFLDLLRDATFRKAIEGRGTYATSGADLSNYFAEEDERAANEAQYLYEQQFESDSEAQSIEEMAERINSIDRDISETYLELERQVAEHLEPEEVYAVKGDPITLEDLEALDAAIAESEARARERAIMGEQPKTATGVAGQGARIGEQGGSVDRGAPRTERGETASVEPDGQSLVPGVAPVTDKDRLDVAANKPLRATKEQKPADDGLFDVGGRGQTDLVDMARAAKKDTKAEAAPEQAQVPAQKQERQTEQPDPNTKTDVPAEDIKRAAKLRGLAEKSLARAEEKYGLDRNANTARRARMAAAAEADAQYEIQIAKTAIKIADAIERGEAGPLSQVSNLAQIKEMNRVLHQAKRAADKDLSYVERQRREGRRAEESDLEHVKLPNVYVHTNIGEYLLEAAKGKKGTADARRRLTRFSGDMIKASSEEDIEAVRTIAKAAKGKEPYAAKRALEQITERERLTKLGFSNDAALRDGIRAFMEIRNDQGQAKKDPIKEAERALIGRKIPGFFQTPVALAERMADLAGIKKGDRVLEPSAGVGRIAEAVAAKAGIENVDVVERVADLQTILKGKGFNVAENDFMEFDGEGYDAVVMNPPFEKNQDIEHVRRAYEMLKPGGRLVAIMGEGAFFRQGKTESAFREWLDNNGGMSEKLPEGTFKESGTGTNTRLVWIDKDSDSKESRFGTSAPVTDTDALKISASDQAKIAARIRQIVKQMAPDANVEVVDNLFRAEPGGKQSPAAGRFNAARNLITVALNYGDPEQTARHETVHFLRDAGLFTAEEWALLEKQARRDWSAKYDVDTLYPTLDRTAKMEEAIAQAFAEWKGGNLKTAPRFRRIFAKLRMFFTRVGNALRGMGYRTVGDIFEGVESGAVGRREGESMGGDTDKYSVFALKKKAAPLYKQPPNASGHQEAYAVIDRVMGTTDVPLRERARENVRAWKDRKGLAVKQAMVDQFAAIEQLEKETYGKVRDAAVSGYKSTRLTQNLSSVMAHVLRHGPMEVYTTKNGGKWFRPKQNWKHGGFENLFAGLAEKGQLRLWKGWAAAVRAKRLAGEDRENLMTDAEIERLIALGGDPNDPSVPAEFPEFQEVHKKWQEFNRAMLDMAEGAGLINSKQRAIWERNDYVPFYRIMEEDSDVTGAGRGKGGIEGQRSGIRRLKGGEAQLNDIIENMVLNMTSMVDRSYKNLAMQKVTDMALQAGAMETTKWKWFDKATVTPEEAAQKLEDIGVQVSGMTAQQHQELLEFWHMKPPTDSDMVSVMVDGKPKYYRVNDPMLLRSITALSPRQMSGIMGAFRMAKRALTEGVTIDPAFMIANFLRDSLSTFVVTGQRRPVIDSVAGFAKALSGTGPTQRAIMAAGAGTGGFYRTDPKDVRKLMSAEVRGINKKTILDTPKKLWEAWHKVGQASESANRISKFEDVKKAGGTDEEAAFQALDLMDFSMRGDHAVVRTLIEVVPFLNARMQGLYKLGRGAAENPEAFIIRGSILMAASMALMAQNWDDERYDELPEWDKDVYWHFWIGDDHYRIPKPFEVGVLFGTLPERIMRSIGEKDSGKASWDAFKRAILDTFALNPMPQLLKPLTEQAFNKDTFTGRPIVGVSLEGLPAWMQANPWTSLGAQEFGEVTGASPVRVEHLVRGYFGTLGMYLLAASDALLRQTGDYPTKPAMRIDDYPVVKRFMRDDPARTTRFVQEFYDLRKQADAIARGVKKLREDGEHEAALELIEDNLDKLALRKGLNRAAKQMSDINKRIRLITKSDMTPEEKRAEIDRQTRYRNELAKAWAQRAPALKRMYDRMEEDPGVVDRVQQAG